MARVPVIVYVQPDAKARLEELAKAKDLSASRVACIMLEAALSDSEGKD